MTVHSRDLEHPSWCIDHRHEMVGPLGECHSARLPLLVDEHGPRIEAHVMRDDVREPNLFIYAAPDPENGIDGEVFAHIDLDALEALCWLRDNHPSELDAILDFAATQTGYAGAPA